MPYLCSNRRLLFTGMRNTTAFMFLGVSVLLAVVLIIVKHDTVIAMQRLTGNLPVGESLVPKSAKALQTDYHHGDYSKDVAYIEERVTRSYSMINFTDDWESIANDSLPEVFLSPQDISDKPTTVLIYVLSSPTSAGRRSLIRRTWGSKDACHNLPWHFQPIVLFILGVSFDVAMNPSLLSSLAHEHNIHNDILLFDFVDSYSNLTAKGFLALSWIDSHFEKVKYILKTDDDILLNIYEWLYQVHLMEVEGCEICICCRIHRVYHNHYPHCKGRGYLMSRGAVRKMLSAYKRESWNPKEDLFYTGYLGYHQGIFLRDTANLSSKEATTNDLAPEVYDPKKWMTAWAIKSAPYQQLYANGSVILIENWRKKTDHILIIRVWKLTHLFSS